MNITDCDLKRRIQRDLPHYTEDHFHSHESDLYVLYSKELENWLRINYDFFCNCQSCIGNVPGSEWYGKRFYDIPFALIDELIKKRHPHENV